MALHKCHGTKGVDGSDFTESLVTVVGCCAMKNILREISSSFGMYMKVIRLQTENFNGVQFQFRKDEYFDWHFKEDTQLMLHSSDLLFNLPSTPAMFNEMLEQRAGWTCEMVEYYLVSLSSVLF